MAILNVIGQCGPLLGTRLYPDSDGPFYVRGMLVCAGFMGLVAVLTISLRWVLVRANRAALADWGSRVEMTEEGEGLVGGSKRVKDDGPFIYIL